MSSSLKSITKSERYGSLVSRLKGSVHATSTRCVGPSASSGGVSHRFLIAAVNCKFRPKGRLQPTWTFSGFWPGSCIIIGTSHMLRNRSIYTLYLPEGTYIPAGPIDEQVRSRQSQGQHSLEEKESQARLLRGMTSQLRPAEWMGRAEGIGSEWSKQRHCGSQGTGGKMVRMRGRDQQGPGHTGVWPQLRCSDLVLRLALSRE